MAHVQDETYPTSIGQDAESFTNMYRKINEIFMNTDPSVYLAQMSAKKSIAKHGNRSIQADLSEFAQLDGKKVVKPLNPATFLLKEENKALRAITLIKEKLCGKLKGRTCADGRKQRPYISKENSTSPTVSTKALVITLAISAANDRNFATCNIVVAYLNTDMDVFTVMKLEGDMVDMMVQVDPEKYENYVVYESGKKTLYLNVLKALYGCIKSELLWYTLFTGTLKKKGFRLNPYNSCVADKMVDEKQCTITWYVDDLKISHVHSAVVGRIIAMVELHYGKMTVTRDKKHVYVGMDIDFIGDGKVTLHQKVHLEECIVDFGEDATTKVSSTAQCHLFSSDHLENLDKAKHMKFHSIVHTFSFAVKRSRPDL